MIYRKCLRYWRMALVTPLLYLLVCVGVKSMVFDARVITGFYPLEAASFSLLRGWLLLIGAVIASLIYLLRRRWWASQRLLERCRTPEAISQALVFRYLALLMLCDLIAFTGCILFLIQGGLWNMMFFAVEAMMAYAAAHPQQLLIDRIYADDKEESRPD